MGYYQDTHALFSGGVTTGRPMPMNLRPQWQYPGVSRCQGMSFVLIWVAFLCMAGTQVLFGRFAYPANDQTRTRSMLP